MPSSATSPFYRNGIVRVRSPDRERPLANVTGMVAFSEWRCRRGGGCQREMLSSVRAMGPERRKVPERRFLVEAGRCGPYIVMFPGSGCWAAAVVSLTCAKTTQPGRLASLRRQPRWIERSVLGTDSVWQRRIREGSLTDDEPETCRGRVGAHGGADGLRILRRGG